MLSKPTTKLTCNQSHQSVAPAADSVSSHTSKAAAAHKPRMRWTPELHERFVEAVSKLDGPESKFSSSSVQKKQDLVEKPLIRAF